MQEIYIESLKKVLQEKNKLEKELNVKIENKGKNIFIKGNPEDEYLTLRILEAINLGFSTEQALLLKNEEIIIQIINIKDLTKRKDLHEVRARVIGTHRKTLDNLENLSNCLISLHDNQVGVIGSAECIKDAIISLKCLIQGSKQGNVYARLERQKKKRRLAPQEKIVNEFKEKK